MQWKINYLTIYEDRWSFLRCSVFREQGERHMERETVKTIKKFIKDKKKEEHVVNEVVRDDVFSILQKECTVLYYALEDSIDGCHIQKPLLGEMRQFVFINTNKVIQEQVWTAGHELGHVWKVDEAVYKSCPGCKDNVETIVGRFTAEFLMPEEIFCNQITDRLKEYRYTGSAMKQEMAVDLIAYLMNFFCVPAKSIILRFIELHYVDESDMEKYLDCFRDNQTLYKQKISENQYTRLEKREEVYTIGNIRRDIEKIEAEQLMKPKYIQRVKELLRMDETSEEGTTLDFRGQN